MAFFCSRRWCGSFGDGGMCPTELETGVCITTCEPSCHCKFFFFPGKTSDISCCLHHVVNTTQQADRSSALILACVNKYAIDCSSPSSSRIAVRSPANSAQLFGSHLPPTTVSLSIVVPSFRLLTVLTVLDARTKNHTTSANPAARMHTRNRSVVPMRSHSATRGTLLLRSSSTEFQAQHSLEAACLVVSYMITRE